MQIWAFHSEFVREIPLRVLSSGKNFTSFSWANDDTTLSQNYIASLLLQISEHVTWCLTVLPISSLYDACHIYPHQTIPNVWTDWLQLQSWSSKCPRVLIRLSIVRTYTILFGSPWNNSWSSLADEPPHPLPSFPHMTPNDITLLLSFESRKNHNSF